MKAYIGASRCMGSEEGAILIFANNIKEAKKLAWNNSLMSDMIDNEYTDLEVRWLKTSPWLFKEMKSKEPHVIESPTMCKECQQWGYELDENGICEGCCQ